MCAFSLLCGEMMLVTPQYKEGRHGWYKNGVSVDKVQR